jgi:hypothetical protein
MKLWKSSKRADKPSYEELEARCQELENLCQHRQKLIGDLRDSIKEIGDNYREEIIKYVKSQAEGPDSSLSYICIEDGKIISSTPTFRRRFGYNDADGLNGMKCSVVLRSPQTNGYAHNLVSLAGFIEDLSADVIEATILDGEKVLRNVSLEKYRPETIRYFKEIHDGEDINYSITLRRVDVYDVGHWRRHKKNTPNNIEGFIGKSKLEELEIQNNELERSMRLVPKIMRNLFKYGIKGEDLIKVWDKLGRHKRNYENFRSGCAYLLKSKRKERFQKK